MRWTRAAEGSAPPPPPPGHDWGIILVRGLSGIFGSHLTASSRQCSCRTRTLSWEKRKIPKGKNCSGLFFSDTNFCVADQTFGSWGSVSAPGIFFDPCPTGDFLGGALSAVRAQCNYLDV